MVDKNIYIIQGEINIVVGAIKRNARWSTHIPLDEERDPLLHSFSNLKEVLNSVTELSEIEPNVFLRPFLEVIRSEDTTGPITGLALTSVNKFLSYALIDPTHEGTAEGMENMADAVTHARFVGTDPASDEVVLMKILQVLRTLLLTPVGTHLTNESVCEIMQSCFRICFEMRLSELLRKFTEHWRSCNGSPFANSDACFALAYAVIMLNTDQHNHNVRKQNAPMTLEEFRKNLKGVNGGKDFEQDILEDMYHAAHITPDNFELCVKTLRIFVEASLNGGCKSQDKRSKSHKYDSCTH